MAGPIAFDTFERFECLSRFLIEVSRNIDSKIEDDCCRDSPAGIQRVQRTPDWRF